MAEVASQHRSTRRPWAARTALVAVCFFGACQSTSAPDPEASAFCEALERLAESNDEQSAGLFDPQSMKPEAMRTRAEVLNIVASVAPQEIRAQAELMAEKQRQFAALLPESDPTQAELLEAFAASFAADPQEEFVEALGAVADYTDRNCPNNPFG